MKFIRVYNGDELKTQLELDTASLSIGRTGDNDIVLNDPGVSRNHATIAFEDGNHVVIDNDSRNGVFVNKRRVKKEKLSFHDEIQIHNFILKVMPTSALGTGQAEDDATTPLAGDDKTMFVSLASERQLDNLRQQSRHVYLTYKDKQGQDARYFIKATSAVIGKAATADIRIPGFFAPGVAARVERQGSNFVVIPERRGKVIFNGQPQKQAFTIKDGQGFLVRNQEFKFFHRLTKT